MVGPQLWPRADKETQALGEACGRPGELPTQYAFSRLPILSGPRERFLVDLPKFNDVFSFPSFPCS